MYQLKLATKEEDIKDFEKMRTEVFNPGRDGKQFKQGAYEKAMKEGEMLGFFCVEDEKKVGGMLLGLNRNNIKIERLFVKPEERGKGAGTFMLNYVTDHQDFFEDYYGQDIDCVVLEPLESATEYYFDKGFDYAGFQMYKRYAPKGRK